MPSTPNAPTITVEPPRVRMLDWIPAFGVIVTILGFVWEAATWQAQVQDNTRRIVALEAIQSEARLARIEAKVDILIDQRGPKK